VTEKNLTDYNLDKEWTVISVNKDWNGFEFISSIEHKKYPFFGIQFHPEKNLFEWVRNKNISHTPNAIIASQYFANFFVNETRKSLHHFKNSKDEDNYVIYNFDATFTGKKGSSFEQSYMFPEGIDYSGADLAKINGILLIILMGFCMIY
jgi:gamma-glutamyl hydrolase